MTDSAGDDRRKENRRRGMVRNLFAYFNRRNLFRRGRRKNEDKYSGPDWFERERAKDK